MPLGRAIGLLVAFALAVITGFWVGFIAGYYAAPAQIAQYVIPAESPRDTTDYYVTPHIMRYYRALTVDHIPAPEGYQRGDAGKNYCVNLAYWFSSIANYLSMGVNRGQLREAFKSQLDYELAHKWLDAGDVERVNAYIASAPTWGPDREVLAGIVITSCLKRRGVRPKGEATI